MEKTIPIHVHAGATPAPQDDVAQGVSPPPPVWLWVGDTAIDEAAIAREMQHHRGHDPHLVRQEAARALVVRELLRLEIERLGLEDRTLPLDGETREEACIRVLLDEEALAPVAVPDEQACRHYFQNNRQRLHRPDRVSVRHILLAAPPADLQARATARAEGERLIAELREHPERFTEFAQRYSACPSKDQGGELGWLQRGDTTPEFERQLFMLEPGLCRLTVETRYGHHVTCVDAVERGEPLTYEEAAPRIATYLEAQARQNAIHQYLQILMERYPVRGLDELETRA